MVLEDELDKSAAPTVTSKVTGEGVDSLARPMREQAETLPLVRALHAGVELDQEIPPESYKATAEFTGCVCRLKDRMPAGGGRVQGWHSRLADDTGEAGMQRQRRT